MFIGWKGFPSSKLGPTKTLLVVSGVMGTVVVLTVVDGAEVTSLLEGDKKDKVTGFKI